MPIDFSRLTLTTDFLSVDAHATVGDLLPLLPQNDRAAAAFAYLLAPLPDGLKLSG